MPLYFRSSASVLLMLTASIGSPAFLAAQEEPPFVDSRPWRILLQQQLLAEKTCELLEVLLFDEFKREGETILEGKISCVDGRKYDFVRRQLHLKFEFALCEPAVC